MGGDLGLHHQLVRPRHDLHDGLAVGDHPADRMHRELVHDPGLRGPQVDAPELILGGDHLLLELGALALGLAQILQHVGAEVLVELDDLQVGLADLAARPRDIGDELPALALELGLVALQQHVARDRDQVLLVEIGDADELLADQLELGFLGLLLGDQAADLLLGLRDALAELRTLAEAGFLARGEQLFLARERRRDRGLVAPGGQLRRKRDRVGVIPLGHEPGVARDQLVELGAHHAEIGARHGVVEAQHHLSFVDRAAVLDQDLADNAAGRMLHLLDAGLDHDRAGRDYRAGELRGRPPAADPADEQHDEGEAREVELADRAARVGCAAAHGWPPESLPLTTLRLPAAGAA